MRNKVVLMFALVFLSLTGCYGYEHGSSRSSVQMPDRFIIDKPGKCEVRCERWGSTVKCREYRC